MYILAPPDSWLLCQWSPHICCLFTLQKNPTPHQLNGLLRELWITCDTVCKWSDVRLTRSWEHVQSVQLEIVLQQRSIPSSNIWYEIQTTKPPATFSVSWAQSPQTEDNICVYCPQVNQKNVKSNWVAWYLKLQVFFSGQKHWSLHLGEKITHANTSP